MCKEDVQPSNGKPFRGTTHGSMQTPRKGIYKMKKLKCMFLDKTVLGASHTNPL